jgi:tRNA-specific 2-thiouridylase
MLNHAVAFGASYMATGHYARKKSIDDRHKLLKAVDENKDQSYVLHILDQQQLSHTLFPLGEYRKEEIRQLARDFNLPVAERNDSQDLCFLSNGDYRDFLIRNSNQAITEGEIINLQGELLGQHRGLPMYTIGQRRGLGVPSSVPLYVVDKDIESNTLIVGPDNILRKQRLWAEDVNWVSVAPPTEPFKACVKIRYKSPDEEATIIPTSDSKVEVNFINPVRGITPGQAAVFYDAEDFVLGGGIIQRSA